jgi:hypothetical protein
VDFHKFQTFSRPFFFSKKFTPGPPQGLPENEFLQKVISALGKTFQGCKTIVELKMVDHETTKTAFQRNSFSGKP